MDARYAIDYCATANRFSLLLSLLFYKWRKQPGNGSSLSMAALGQFRTPRLGGAPGGALWI